MPIINGSLLVKLPPPPALPIAPGWDARTMLKAATARAKEATANARIDGLFRIATAQMELGDIPAASETLTQLATMTSSRNLTMREQAWAVGMSVRAGLPPQAKEFYYHMTQDAVPARGGSARNDPIAFAFAAAMMDEEAILNSSVPNFATAPVAAVPEKTESLTAMSSFNIRAAKSLAKGDRAAAERSLKDYQALVGTTPTARFSLRLNEKESYLRGPDFQRFLPIPLQLALDDLAQGKMHDAAVRLEAFDQEPYARGTIELMLAILARQHRGKEAVALCRALQTMWRGSMEPPWMTSAASVLAKEGHFERALEALALPQLRNPAASWASRSSPISISSLPRHGWPSPWGMSISARPGSRPFPPNKREPPIFS